MTTIWSPVIQRALLEEVTPTTLLVERAERFLTVPSRFA
jgi:hypothetical protein